MIDSKDAKAKVQADVSPVQKPGKTWRKHTLPDHDWSASVHNSVTPMTHLFMETEVNLEDATEEEYRYTVKRSGSAAILVNLLYFEPETVQRAFNELFLLLANPALDQYFRNPETRKLKEHFIFIVADNEVSHSKIICRISQQEESSGTSSRRRKPHFVERGFLKHWCPQDIHKR